MDRINPPASDDTQEVRGNRDGSKGEHFGNEYDSHDHPAPERVLVGSGNGGMEAGSGAGRRGTVDQRTGEVHGSGAGAGGGSGEEDLDQDDAGGGATQRPDR